MNGSRATTPGSEEITALSNTGNLTVNGTHGVQRKQPPVPIVTSMTGPADLRDQRWLDSRIEAIENGIEAVLDIARNWTDGMNLGRLHPGMSAADYVGAHVGHAVGRDAILPLLTESNWSHSQIAAIAGVSRQAVDQRASTLRVVRPDKTLGADGRLRSAPVRVVTGEIVDEPAVEHDVEATQNAQRVLDELVDWIARLEALYPAADIANVIDARRHGTNAKRLRKAGMVLGRWAWMLEGGQS